MFIYVMYADPYYKIGVSKNPTARLKQLQTSSAAKLKLYKTFPVPVKTARKLEQQLHRMFWQRRVRCNGEWFDLSAAHLEVLEQWLSCYTLTN